LCLEATIAAFRARVASSSAFLQLFPFGMDVIRLSPVRARAGDDDDARRLFEFEVEVALEVQKSH
jgi:hypothetical protein